MTSPATQPEPPPMPLPEYLRRAAAHFRQWTEDFQDYARDYYDENEARERRNELDEMTALANAADYWDRNYSNPSNPG